MDSSLPRSNASQETFGPESFGPNGGKSLGLYQGGRSRNFRMAQGLQFVASRRGVSPEASVPPAGETNAALEFAAIGSAFSNAMAFAESDRR